MNFYSWGDPTKLQNREIRSRETDGWVCVYPSSTNHSVAHIIKTLNIFFSHSVVVDVFSNFIFRLKMFLPRVVKPFYSVEYWFPEGRNVT